ncbi:MAG: hypothetical protein ACN4GK_06565 [Acidimicrobiia bacterium]
MDSTQNIQQWFAAAGISVEVVFAGDSLHCPSCGSNEQLAA